MMYQTKVRDNTVFMLCINKQVKKIIEIKKKQKKKIGNTMIIQFDKFYCICYKYGIKFQEKVYKKALLYQKKRRKKKI